MKWPKAALLISFLFGFTNASAQPKEKPGAKDPALFSRIPGFVLVNVVEKQFDAYEFFTTPLRKDSKRVEGRFGFHTYQWGQPKGAPSPSTLQVIRNYQNAAARIGGKTVFEDAIRTTILIAKGGQETWVEVHGGNLQYWLRIVEKQAMQQDVTANAAAFQSSLADQGHVEVPGIFFDFAKSEVKPESDPALQEVAVTRAQGLGGRPHRQCWHAGGQSQVVRRSGRSCDRVLTQRCQWRRSEWRLWRRSVFL
jgi:hypothetical protein